MVERNRQFGDKIQTETVRDRTDRYEVKMELKQWQRLARQSLVFLGVMLMLCGAFSGALPEETGPRVKAGARTEETAEPGPVMTPEAEKPSHARKNTIESLSNTYIMISKSETATASAVYMVNDYMDRTVTLHLEGMDKGTVTRGEVRRINGTKVTAGPVQKKDGSDLVQSLKIQERRKKGLKKYRVQIKLQLKELYEPRLYETEDAYYITLLSPETVYDKIVVIDAGHGGMDEGTVSADGRQKEKDYNLYVVERLKKRLDQSGIGVYYTRLDDRAVSKKKRVWLANTLNADLLVSVHCNASDPGDTSAFGVEALYSERSTNSSLSGKQLAGALKDNVVKSTGNRDRGLIQREQLYLLHHSKVPASIIEIGYMSNALDLKYIRKARGQEEIAEGIYQGILEALNKK